jgi:hypothetical protein
MVLPVDALSLLISVMHRESSYIIYHRPICIKNVCRGIVTCSFCKSLETKLGYLLLSTDASAFVISFINIRDRDKCCKVILCISSWWSESELGHQYKSLHTSFWVQPVQGFKQFPFGFNQSQWLLGLWIFYKYYFLKCWNNKIMLNSENSPKYPKISHNSPKNIPKALFWTSWDLFWSKVKNIYNLAILSYSKDSEVVYYFEGWNDFASIVIKCLILWNFELQ